MDISYALLYDLVRKERASAELQELQVGFYDDAKAFLSALQQDAGTDEVTLLQFSNSRKLLKELYDRREQKILLLAQNRARTASTLVDSPNLLPRERTLFDRVVSVLAEARFGATTTTVERTQTRTIIETVKVKETVETVPAAPGAEPSIESNESVEHVSVIEEEPITVRITKSVPQFLGKDMETFGPFSEHEVVELPTAVAMLLIRKGSAEKDE